MAVTYEPLASTTLGSAAASVTFGSGGTLPQTYTDLVLVTFARTTTALTYDDITLRFNGDSGSNYSRTFVYGNGTSALSGRASNQSRLYYWTADGTGVPSNTYPMAIAQVMSYSNTNVFKTVLSSTDLGDYVTVRQVGLWRSTSAITSIVIEPGPDGTPNLAAGSTFSLFGIKASA